ncbi:N-lysine methyltransferase KMT5A-like [Babylonia areolata]|uniref:N-lysine methyltransferase KMT5A-like n=1 Tax=Babylonia areolata TaxID=304850 RepID=UPI003FD27D78
MAQVMLTNRAAASRITDFFVNGDVMPVDPAPTPTSPVPSDSNSGSTDLKKPRKRGRRPKSATARKGSTSAGAKVAGQETKDKSSSGTEASSTKTKGCDNGENPQKPITAFFPVRRSDRRGMSSAEVKVKSREMEIVEKIKAGCEDGLQVTEIEGKGRGVVATKEFHRDDFVVEYAGELVSITTARQREQLYEKDEEVGCYMYYFTHRNKHYCIDATAESGKLGRLLNHSRRGNCYTKVFAIGDRPALVLLASQTIKKGQELTYDYGDRSQTALESHPWLKL